MRYAPPPVEVRTIRGRREGDSTRCSPGESEVRTHARALRADQGQSCQMPSGNSIPNKRVKASITANMLAV